MKKTKKRQIIIETDGTDIEVTKTEISDLELFAILIKILNKLTKK